MKEQKVRESVADSYAKAVSKPSSGSCCGPAPSSVVTQLAGYTREELDSLPAEAVTKAFGCGNPLAFSEVKEGDVLLDLGSGAGIDVLLAAKKVGPTGRAIGIDMTPEMLAKARENIAASGMSNVEVREGIIEELPVESGSVDWVISNCVINLSPEKARVFAEIARVLKPGGRMLVSDIMVEELPAAIRENQTLYSSCVAGAISENQYLRGLRDAGLVDVAVHDRLVYDESQLRQFIAEELSEGDGACGCGCAGSVDPDTVDTLIQSLVGKICSAKVFARKPVK
ncbi:MAG: arsenite methyltransferase [Phycisphaerales bacterium]|nr:MAG: arsenite methyltransferase [Phycisphaerales bacterium]